MKENEHYQRLFKSRHGRVQVEVWGPRIGYQYRQVSMFRYRPSTSVPGKFDRVELFHARDLGHMQQCLSDVQTWAKETGEL